MTGDNPIVDPEKVSAELERAISVYLSITHMNEALLRATETTADFPELTLMTHGLKGELIQLSLDIGQFSDSTRAELLTVLWRRYTSALLSIRNLADELLTLVT